MKRINSLYFIAVLLFSSCSVQIVENKSEDDKDSNKQWVYCSPEDKLKGHKSYIKHDDMLCLKDSLNIGGISIYFKQHVKKKNTTRSDLIGFNELIVRNRTKILKKIRLERKGDPFYLITGFVKLREGKYLVDLNDDGIQEFSFVRYGSDRNRFTKAQIYSITKNGKIKLFGKGVYNKDQGKHVLFGCPDCHTLNPDACQSCY